MARFGEQRLLRGRLERQFFRVFGVPDPAHYLRHRYLARALRAFEPRPRRILDAGSGHVEDDLAPEEFVERVTVSGLEVLEARRTFARWTGEAACSLFALPYANTPLNRMAQIALTPVCKILAMSDTLGGGARYALAVTARKPASDA